LSSFSEKSANLCSFSVTSDDYELPQSNAETDSVSTSGLDLRAKKKFSNSRKAENSDMLYNIVSKSREIHRKMMIKKDRWKPSELELAILKLYFEKNQFPSSEEKHQVIERLEKAVGSKVNMNQISRWFQLEREKKNNIGLKKNHKTIYKKFSKDELDFLKDSFDKKNYPKVEEMKDMAGQMGVNLSKIENWYKHNRRMLSKNGSFYLKSKKYFKKSELTYLTTMFEKHPRPSKEILLEIAQNLNCTELQIKNWYSNKRKKCKFTPKSQISFCSHETDLHQTEFPSFKVSSPLELQSQLSSHSYSNFETENVSNPASDMLKRFLALKELNSHHQQQQQQSQINLANYLQATSPPNNLLIPQKNSSPLNSLLLSQAQKSNSSFIFEQQQPRPESLIPQQQNQNQYLIIPTSALSIAQNSQSNPNGPQIIICNINPQAAGNSQLMSPMNQQAQSLQLSQLFNSQNYNNMSMNTTQHVGNNMGSHYNYNSLIGNNNVNNHMQSLHLVNDPNKLNNTIQQLLQLKDISQQQNNAQTNLQNNLLYLSGQQQNYFGSRNHYFTG